MDEAPVLFNVASPTGKEREYIADVIARGYIAGDGVYTKKCHELLETALGAKKALLTTSCTHALEMCGLLLDLEPGDEVVVPSFTFVSTVNAFVLRGARPVFCDIRPDTLNIDETKIERLLTKRTKAIVPVHYAGVGCEMDAILELALHHGIAVVEDNAHGLFAKYKGQSLGSFGCLATQSFHETKNITCGEGGALVINDARFVERAEIIREKGTNRSRFFRGQVDKYTWVERGSSYLPSEILAAFLLAQLERRDHIQNQRREIWHRYDRELRNWAKAHDVKTPSIPEHCEQAYHMYYLVVPSLALRQSLIAHLKSRGVASAFHYLPLHLSEMGKRYGGKEGDCPVTEWTSERLLRLPLYNSLSEADQVRVIEGLRLFKF